jgi:hypothetical protein
MDIYFTNSLSTGHGVDQVNVRFMHGTLRKEVLKVSELLDVLVIANY